MSTGPIFPSARDPTGHDPRAGCSSIAEWPNALRRSRFVLPFCVWLYICVVAQSPQLEFLMTSFDESSHRKRSLSVLVPPFTRPRALDPDRLLVLLFPARR